MHDLKSFFVFFDNLHPIKYSIVSEDVVPHPYNKLLVHNNHMTSTLEHFYGQPLQITVHKQEFKENIYKRSSFLWLPQIGVVQIGIISMDVSVFEKDLRNDILSGKKPLGKILIDYDEPRNVKVENFFKIQKTPALTKTFSSEPNSHFYGRLTTLVCKTMIYVVEIIRP